MANGAISGSNVSTCVVQICLGGSRQENLSIVAGLNCAEGAVTKS